MLFGEYCRFVFIKHYIMAFEVLSLIVCKSLIRLCQSVLTLHIFLQMGEETGASSFDSIELWITDQQAETRK